MTFFLLFIFENDVNAPSKSNKQENFDEKFFFIVGDLKVHDGKKNQDPDPDPLVRGMLSTDPDPHPDPYQNVMNLQHRKIPGISFRLRGPENGCSLCEGGVE